MNTPETGGLGSRSRVESKSWDGARDDLSYLSGLRRSRCKNACLEPGSSNSSHKKCRQPPKKDIWYCERLPGGVDGGSFAN